ncbi:uncharacterized protein FPRN_01296 [Fusarium proliferatum]|nr:uncharacterized protein FPRN_01296 [Fusarium proliferatum]
MEDPGHVMEEETDSTTSFLTNEVPHDLARLYYTVQKHGPGYHFDAELDASRISSQLPPSWIVLTAKSIGASFGSTTGHLETIDSMKGLPVHFSVRVAICLAS